MQGLEGGFVELLARLADRGCRRRFVLRQGDVGLLALLPQLAEGCTVALPARSDDQTEDEQHDQQGAEHAAALLPACILALRHGGGGGDERLPLTGETATAAARAPAFRRCLRPRRLCRIPVFAAQDLPTVPAQRQDVDTLDGLALVSPGLPDAFPVGRTVARGPEAILLDEGLAQDRPVAMQFLPVVAEAPRRQRQGAGGKVLRPYPWKHQPAGIGHHKGAVAVPAPVVPPDPAFAAGQRFGRRIEQKAAQPAAPAVRQEVADVRPEGAAVPEIMVTVHTGVPQLTSLGVRDQLEAQGLQLPERCRNQRPGIRCRTPDRLAAVRTDHVLPLLRQAHNAVLLKMLQHPHAGTHLVVALRRHPVEMLADGLAQFVAAVVRQQVNRLLDLGNLAPGQPAAGEGGRIQGGDSRVHRMCSVMTSTACIFAIA